MHTLDITFRSTNSATYPKPITALVVEPDAVGQQTGVLLVSHGWGGSRRDYLPTMEYAARELGGHEPGPRHAPARASGRRDSGEVLSASRASRSCRRRGAPPAFP